MFFQYLYESENLPLTRGKSYRKAVRAVIMKNGQLLMLRTINGDFKFPGGGVKKEEEDTEALRREVMEETGFGLSQVGACLGRVLERKKDDFLEDTTFEMESLYFLCSASLGSSVLRHWKGMSWIFSSLPFGYPWTKPFQATKK